MKNILEVIKDDPFLGVATFSSMGWQIDNFAHEYISQKLKEVGFVTDDYERWEATIICSALMAAVCHESSVDDPYDMDPDIGIDSNEILVHGMIHPENLSTIINIEQGWKLVTTHERMESVIAGYLFSNKNVKGISRRHINDLEIDRDHTHVVVLQDTSISKFPLIGEFSLDDFNIEIQSGGGDKDYDEYEDEDEDDYDYDEDDLDDEEDEEDDGWVDYDYDEIDNLIDGMMNRSSAHTDFLNKFWGLFSVGTDSPQPSQAQSKDNNLPPKSRIKSNKSNTETPKTDFKDIALDSENPFYKFINDLKSLD